MVTICGKGVSAGAALGKLFVVKNNELQLEKHTSDDFEKEKKRIDEACGKAKLQFEAAAEKCRRTADEESAAIFDAYLLLVEDEGFLTLVYSILEKEGCNAEYAVRAAGEQLAARFEQLEDDYMRARGSDVCDVAKRIADNLNDSKMEIRQPDEAVILAAKELPPFELLQYDVSRIAGIILRQGTENDHTAILARAMEIPAVFAVGDDFAKLETGEEACMNGESGIININPDDAAKNEYLAAFRECQLIKDKYISLKGLESISKGGRKIEIRCNIDMPSEVSRVIENDGDGVGLFRTEFLLLSEAGGQSEEKQFEEYKKVVAALKGKRVVIRTVDIGDDKQMPDKAKLVKNNRGIQNSLDNEEQFKEQVRAIYRASAYGKAAIMFPMVSTLGEVKECKRICCEVREELAAAGIGFDNNLEIGIMIETESAVRCVEELAAEVDFFSIGTNDLTQDLLSCNRFSGDADSAYDARHPLVIDAIDKVTQAAHRKGIKVCICGELAADSEMLEKFLDIGIDEISVIPPKVLELRAKVRGME